MADLAYREVYTMTRMEARLRLVTTYHETSSIRETARRWRTSRQVVRKWIRRYQAEGLSGLEDRSRRPRTSPRQTPPQIEEQVLEAWEKTPYGRHRLALYAQRRAVSKPSVMPSADPRLISIRFATQSALDSGWTGHAVHTQLDIESRQLLRAWQNEGST